MKLQAKALIPLAALLLLAAGCQSQSTDNAQPSMPPAQTQPTTPPPTSSTPTPAAPVTPPPHSTTYKAPAPKPTTTPTANVLSGQVNISIDNFSFNPAKITVKKGTIVTWTNNDRVNETVTSAHGPSSQTLAPLGMYTYTFNTVGTFAYHSIPYPTVTGVVVVVN